MNKLEFKNNADFSATYEVEEVEYSPGEPLFRFSTENGDHFARRLCLRFVTCEGDTWWGEFQQGFSGVSGAFSTPDPSTVCVIADGIGYWVHTESPRNYTTLQSFPIRHVLSLPNYNSLVFADFRKMEAYGHSGLKWLTSDITWDGFTNIHATEKTIDGYAYDAPTGRQVPVSVDIATGHVVGGARSAGAS